MRKFLPLVVGGIAAISFSALAADNTDKTPQAQSQGGRSVDTGGAKPDSSRTEGAMPANPNANARGDASGSVAADANTGADKPASKETRKEKRAERKAKRNTEGNATSGASTDTTGSTGATVGAGAASGASTTAPVSPQSGSAPATSTPGNVGSPNSGGASK